MTDALEQYFDEASGWERDRSAALATSSRRAWRAAAGAAVMACLACMALVLLTPLKRVEPFLVRVDASTGAVDVVPVYAGTADLPDTVTRHLVHQYVVQRERYVPALAESDYEQIGAFHSAAMNQAWAAAWARSNPGSPLNRYADGTQLRAQVESVSFLRHEHGLPDLVQVRFLTMAERDGAAAGEAQRFVATLQVAFGAPSADVRLRALNPLGFKVLEYRREPEAAPRPAAAPGGLP